MSSIRGLEAVRATKPLVDPTPRSEAPAPASARPNLGLSEVSTFEIASARGGAPRVRTAENGDWLGGPTRTLDGTAVGPQQAAPGWRFRGDVLATPYDSATTGLRDVPPLVPSTVPSGGRPAAGPVTIYVNGIDTSPGLARDNAQQYADLTGRPVVGLYNATSNPFGDVIESGAQRLRLRNDRAVARLRDAVYGELRAGRSVNVAAESQGGIMTANALEQVRAMRLRDHGYNQWLPPFTPGNRRALQATDADLGRVTVETFGEAAGLYPDGPRYVHYLNGDRDGSGDADLVQQVFGLEYGSRAGGRGAVYRRMDFGFEGSNPIENRIRAHTFPEYLQYLQDEGLWVPPETATPDPSGWIDD